MNIVIIDSGVGAEEILKTLRKKDLSSNYTLLLDKSFFPYGNKTKEELNQRFNYLLSYIESNIDLIIVGCNTLSILVDKYYTKRKIIDMVSITNEYLNKNNFNKILLLGTSNTIKNNPFNTTFFKSVDKLINAIQKSDYEEELRELFCTVDDEYDCIILGCTHLIKVKNEFRNHYKCNIISQDELIKIPNGNIKIKEV